MKLTERKLITVGEAARVLDIHLKTYERKAKAGILPMWIYIGDDRRVVVAELNEWIESKRKDRDSGHTKAPARQA